jgi:hypothetical protein
LHVLQSGGLDVASKRDSLVLLVAGTFIGIATYVVAARALRISEVQSVLRLRATGRPGR